MTLQSSGQIALSDLRTEYTNLGSTAQVAMNDFYYGSTHLKKNKCTDKVRTDTSHPVQGVHFAGIPVLGSGSLIKLTQFYGKIYYYARQTVATVSGNNASVNVGSIENEALKSNSVNSAFFELQTNGNCTATSTSNDGLNIPGGSRPGTTCYFTNNYKIYGKGGNGGNANGGNGQDGGPAFVVSSNIYVNNGGRILGGGGGGGAGNGKTVSYNECYCCNTTNAGFGGGGGGGGAGGGKGGNAGPIPGANFQYSGQSGSDGNYNDSGANGSGGSRCHSARQAGTVCINPGANGGDWGSGGGTSNGGGGSGGKGIRRKSGKYYVVLTSGTVAGGTHTF